MFPFLNLQGYNNATWSNTDHPDRAVWNTYTTLLSWHGVQEIYCASISNIGSVVAGTTNVLGSEAFILWLPRLQIYIYIHVTMMYIYMYMFVHVCLCVCLVSLSAYHLHTSTATHAYALTQAYTHTCNACTCIYTFARAYVLCVIILNNGSILCVTCIEACCSVQRASLPWLVWWQ